MLLIYKRYLQVALVIALLSLSTGGNAQNTAELELSGLATYTETARDIYVGGLLLPPGSGVQNLMVTPPPKAMAYHIATRRISGRGFSGTLLLQGELGSGERAPDPVIAALAKLKTVLKSSLIQGDRFVITLSEDDETTFYLNNSELMQIEDGTVFDFFFAGWVGDSSSALFRDKLLSGNIDPDTLDRFNSLQPGDQRIALIEDWTRPPAPKPAPPQPEPEPEPVIQESAAETQVAAATPAAAGPGVTDTTTPAPVATDTTEALQTTADDLTADVATPDATTPDAATDAAGSVATGAGATAVAALDPATAVPEPASTPVDTSATASSDASTESEDDSGIAESIAGSTEPDADALPALDDREYQTQLREYTSQVMRLVYGKVKYPKRAVKNDWEGKVEVLVRMDVEGELIEAVVDSSSGHGSLDKAAQNAVNKAAPFPQLGQAAREELLDDDGVTYIMSIPVTFKLNR